MELKKWKFEKLYNVEYQYNTKMSGNLKWKNDGKLPQFNNAEVSLTICFFQQICLLP
jgi:hypothetical protein